MWKTAKKCFRTYLCNGTCDWHKKTTKVPKLNGECLKNGYKAGEATFLLVSWQWNVRLTQNNHQNAKKRTANALNPVSKSAKQRFRPYPSNSRSDWHKIPQKCSKINGKCRKTGFKAGKAMFSHICWQHYVCLMQNNHQSAQKRKANTVYSVSKPAKQRFFPYFSNSMSNRRKITTKVLKKRTANAIKTVLKPAKQRFRLYLGKGTSHWRKITTKVLKKERQMP